MAKTAVFSPLIMDGQLYVCFKCVEGWKKLRDGTFMEPRSFYYAAAFHFPETNKVIIFELGLDGDDIRLANTREFASEDFFEMDGYMMKDLLGKIRISPLKLYDILNEKNENNGKLYQLVMRNCLVTLPKLAITAKAKASWLEGFLKEVVSEMNSREEREEEQLRYNNMLGILNLLFHKTPSAF